MQVFDTAPSSALTHNLIVYQDGSGGITGMGGRSAVGSFFGNNSKQSVRVYREVELNKWQIIANRMIHEQNPTARSCVDTLKHHIFSDPPELSVDGKRIDMGDSFRRLYEAEWLPFLSAFFDECCIKGAPAVRLRHPSETAGHDLEDPVPQIVNDMDIYCYTTYLDLSSDKQGFRVLRNISRTNGRQLNDPKPDPLIFVMSGFADSDPDINGNIRTSLTSLQSQEGFMRTVQDCAASAEPLRCAPFAFSQSEPKSAGASATIGRKSYFANHDVHELREEDAFFMDDLAAKQADENQRLYDRFWHHVIGGDTRLANPSGDPYKRKQAEKEATARLQAGMRAAFSVAVRPLPVGHTLVPGPQPAPRTDLVNLQELFQEQICSSYGIPRRYLLGEISKTATGATVSQETFTSTIRKWRGLFSRVMTYLYNAIYGSADAAFMLQRGLLKPETQMKPVEFRLPDVVSAEIEGLVQMYALQIIPWPTFKTAMLRLNHLYIPGSVKASEIDPWGGEQRVEMIKQQSDKLGLSQTGIAATTVLGVPMPSAPPDEVWINFL